MNTGYRIYWAWVFFGIAMFFAGGVSFKHEAKNLGTWLFILSNLSIYFGVGFDLLRRLDGSQPRPINYEEETKVIHTHNHYYHDRRSNVVEGVETIEAKPDGSVVTTRHIKKWN